MQPDFSAAQTVWRRGRDSNSRYRSECRKDRRLRKLQGINLLSGDRGPDAVTALGQTSAVSSPIQRRMAGDSAAESGLYNRPDWFTPHCVRATQSKSEKYLR